MTPDWYTEREAGHKRLLARMEAFRTKLAADGHWCDFIDPSSGQPFYSDSAATFAECDERRRFLGFEMLELGCWRAVSCERFGQCMVLTSAFVEAPMESLNEKLTMLEVDPSD